MCRSVVAGGRRCPACEPQRRSAYRRALYAAQKGATTLPGVDADTSIAVERSSDPDVASISAEDLAASLVQVRAELSGGGADPDETTETVISWGRQIAVLVDEEADARREQVFLEAEEVSWREYGEFKAAHEGLLAEQEAISERHRKVLSEFQAEHVGKRVRDDEPTRERLWALEAQHGKNAEALNRMAKLSDRLSMCEAEAAKAVLGRLRTTGAGTPLVVANEAHKPAVAILNSVMDCFPADWLQRSNTATSDGALPFCPRSSAGRSHYRQRVVKSRDKEPVVYQVQEFVPSDSEVPEGASVIGRDDRGVRVMREETRMKARDKTIAEVAVPGAKVPEDRRKAVAVHEFVHHCEALNRDIGKVEAAFLRRRCDTTKTQQIFPGNTKERAYGDDFVDTYVGKVYAGSYAEVHHEVLSVGAQAVFGGDYDALRGGERVYHTGPEQVRKADPEHRAFVLGVFALL